MSKKDNTVSAALVIIGNEILSGRTQDANLNYLAKQLTSMGIQMSEVRAIRDDMDEIIDAVNSLRKRFDYVFTTGGIGPTHDDITSKSIAKAFNLSYGYHKEAYAILEKYYGKSKFNDGRKKMAKMPRTSQLIYNPSSAAPGFKIKNIFCLPGVPSILQSMIVNCQKFLIKGKVKSSVSIYLETVESNIAKELGKIQRKYFKDIDIGSYPFFRLGKIGVAIVLRSSNQLKLNNCKSDVKKMVIKKNIKMLKS